MTDALFSALDTADNNNQRTRKASAIAGGLIIDLDTLADVDPQRTRALMCAGTPEANNRAGRVA